MISRLLRRRRRRRVLHNRTVDVQSLRCRVLRQQSTPTETSNRRRAFSAKIRSAAAAAASASATRFCVLCDVCRIDVCVCVFRCRVAGCPKVISLIRSSICTPASQPASRRMTNATGTRTREARGSVIVCVQYISSMHGRTHHARHNDAQRLQRRRIENGRAPKLHIN